MSTSSREEIGWNPGGVLEYMMRPLFFRFILHVAREFHMLSCNVHPSKQISPSLRRYHNPNGMWPRFLFSGARKSFGCVRRSLPCSDLHVEHPRLMICRSSTVQPGKGAHFAYTFSLESPTISRQCHSTKFLLQEVVDSLRAQQVEFLISSEMGFVCYARTLCTNQTALVAGSGLKFETEIGRFHSCISPN